MLKCYYCKDPIIEKNKSFEHIINNSLGGKLGSYNLLCKTCNNEKLREIDVEISNQIYLTTILDIKRDRKSPPKVKGQTRNGEFYYVDNHLKPSYSEFKVEIESDTLKYRVRNEKEAKAILRKHKKKNPSINIEEELNKINWKSEKVDDYIYFQSSLVHGLKGNNPSTP